MSVTVARPRTLRFVVPSLTPSSPRTPVGAPAYWRQARWVRWAVKVALCLIAMATGLAIGGY